jgi:hypothetical protein
LPLAFPLRAFPDATLYAPRKALTLIRAKNFPGGTSPADPETLALGALVWVLSDDDRADRLQNLTGLTGDDLRARLGERPVLAAVLEYLCAYEPDLIGAAEHLGVGPQVLADAALALSA